MMVVKRQGLSSIEVPVYFQILLKGFAMFNPNFKNYPVSKNVKAKLCSAMLFLITVLVSSCDAWYEIPELVYIIKEGSHTSNVQGSLPGNGLRSLKSTTLEFTARFDQSAVYNLGNNDQQDVNKLYGFSDCNSHHQNNSARFGWAYNLESNEVDIYAYVYNNGNRVIQLIGSAGINETNLYRITLEEGSYLFEFKNFAERVNRGSDCGFGLYYLLYPYFGGNAKSPHDIKIYITEQLN